MRSKNHPWGVPETTLLRQKTPQYYRDRAEEARIRAEAMTSPGGRSMMVDIATEWDRIAERVERRDAAEST